MPRKEGVNLVRNQGDNLKRTEGVNMCVFSNLDDVSYNGYYFRGLSYEKLGESDVAKQDLIHAARRGSAKAKELLKSEYSDPV